MEDHKAVLSNAAKIKYSKKCGIKSGIGETTCEPGIEEKKKITPAQPMTVNQSIIGKNGGM